MVACHRFERGGCASRAPRTRRCPFWSPDSRWVGFSANGKLQKVDVIGGGQPQVICEIEGRAGGTWNQDGVIVFDQGRKPIQRVSAAGGTPTPSFRWTLHAEKLPIWRLIFFPMAGTSCISARERLSIPSLLLSMAS